MLLQEVKEKTDSTFSSPLQLPEASVQLTDRIEALRKCNLTHQVSPMLFQARREQASSLGFQEFTLRELTEMLMGEPPHSSWNSWFAQRQVHEWVYNHHSDTAVSGADCIWGSTPTEFARWKIPYVWSKWRCRFGKLNYLNQDIPYGVVLRMLECRELKLFNAFGVLAPAQAWRKDQPTIDPIVVGEIWELPDDGNNSGREAYFFLAQW